MKIAAIDGAAGIDGQETELGCAVGAAEEHDVSPACGELILHVRDAHELGGVVDAFGELFLTTIL